ncbi:hypothetical protein CCHOA_09975 [Corynebacterium choanae]|uniref:Uncharacterized protein n=1 Tax=Corynebacterium choanae TaxID=1862358 RepID=A0A3G6JBD0_9CORY|nr:hypothetical protein CCHOA_09975 [Corynebacterium choanae]
MGLLTWIDMQTRISDPCPRGLVVHRLLDVANLAAQVFLPGSQVITNTVQVRHTELLLHNSDNNL